MKSQSESATFIRWSTDTTGQPNSIPAGKVSDPTYKQLSVPANLALVNGQWQSCFRVDYTSEFIDPPYINSNSYMDPKTVLPNPVGPPFTASQLAAAKTKRDHDVKALFFNYGEGIVPKFTTTPGNNFASSENNAGPTANRKKAWWTDGIKDSH